MAFNPVDQQVPTRIPVFTLTLTLLEVWDPDAPTADEKAEYRLVLVDQNDREIAYRFSAGDAIPHMTAQQQQTALQLVQELKALAVTNLIG